MTVIKYAKTRDLAFINYLLPKFLAIKSPKTLFPVFVLFTVIIKLLVSLFFVAVVNLFDSYSPIKFLIFIFYIASLFTFIQHSWLAIYTTKY